jgi:MFS family permease
MKFDYLTALFGKLVDIKTELGESDIEHGIRRLTLDGVCSIAMVSLQGGAILSAFAVAMGATNYEIGLISTIALIGQLMVFPGIFLVNLVPKRKALNFICAGISRIVWIPIILMPALFIDRGVSFLLLWLLISSVFGALPGAAWNSWLRDILPANRLGTIMARRSQLGTIISILCVLISGYVIDIWSKAFPNEPNLIYSMLFLIGLFLGLKGLLFLADIPEPRMKIERSVPIWTQLRAPFQDKNFSQLLKFSVFWNIAINLSGPFFVVYMLKRIGLSVFWVTILSVISQVASTIFIRMWGRLADRYSNKSILSVSGYLFLISVIAWCFTTLPERHSLTIPMLVCIHIFSGASMAGVNLGVTNISLKLSPHHQAHIYVAIFATVSALAGMGAPVVGGAMADFFQVRELAININWQSPTENLSVSAINFRALDFIFLIAVMIGLFARRFLGQINEKGEVNDDEVLDQLIIEMATPLRSVSSLTGMRRIVQLPGSVYRKLRPNNTVEGKSGHD